MTAPLPPRFIQGESVLCGGVPVVVAVVYPADRAGRRLYGLASSLGDGRFVKAGVAEEGELAPAVVS